MDEVTVSTTANGIAVVEIDRPHARNAIALHTIDSLNQAFDHLDRSDISVVVLRGAGHRAFVSGGDLRELGAIRDTPGAEAMALRMRRFLDRLATYPLPVIAAVNGHALGGGAEVAVAADIRVASDDVKIGFTQVSLGIIPAWGGAERLAELVGRSQAMLLIGTGASLSADEAQRLGLVQRVFPRSAFDDGWQRLAEQFATLPAGAARAVKAVIAAARPNHHPHLESEAAKAFASLWTSPAHWDAVERANAARQSAGRSLT